MFREPGAVGRRKQGSSKVSIREEGPRTCTASRMPHYQNIVPQASKDKPCLGAEAIARAEAMLAYEAGN